MYVDSHQHFWKLSRGDYSWLSKENKPLYRNFFPENLIELINYYFNLATILLRKCAPKATGRPKFPDGAKCKAKCQAMKNAEIEGKIEEIGINKKVYMG